MSMTLLLFVFYDKNPDSKHIGKKKRIHYICIIIKNLES